MKACTTCGNTQYIFHDCFQELLHSAAIPLEVKASLDVLYISRCKQTAAVQDELDDYKRKFDTLCMVFEKVLDLP